MMACSKGMERLDKTEAIKYLYIIFEDYVARNLGDDFTSNGSFCEAIHMAIEALNGTEDTMPLNERTDMQ